MADYSTMSVKELREGLSQKKFSSVELTEFFIQKAKKENETLNAYLEIFDDALDQAKEADKRIQNGEDAPLLGIPVALKDNILIDGKTVSAGSKILEHYTASYDAFVTEKLKAAGAVFIGRTNLDEFAMGGSTENSAYGVVKNPHDTTRVAGGSSGGSAAAVAAGTTPIAYGSDTGGSIRQPASFCGVVGLKPTYGSVSRAGLIAMGSSLDVIGPFAHSVGDCKVAFDVIKGPDPKDATTIQEDTHPKVSVKEKMTIGVPIDFLKESVSNEMMERFQEVLEGLKQNGHTVKEIALPHLKYSLAAYYVIMPAEASTNLARFDGVRYGLRENGSNLLDVYKQSRAKGFGPEVRRRILLGTYVLSSGYYDAYYGKATAVRETITKEVLEAFTDVDVIATPTSPTAAFKIGEKVDPVSMYLADIFTVSANIAGIPGLSVPMKPAVRHDTQLPLGFQILAPHCGEEVLFALGRDIENLS